MFASESFAIVGLVEEHHVETEPIAESLGHPPALCRKFVSTVIEQPPLFDLDGELLAKLAEVPVHGVSAGNVDLLVPMKSHGFAQPVGMTACDEFVAGGAPNVWSIPVFGSASARRTYSLIRPLRTMDDGPFSAGR